MWKFGVWYECQSDSLHHQPPVVSKGAPFHHVMGENMNSELKFN